ncbi:MAG: chemotaxis protein CheD [Gemmatimonadetes bacterium]|nr:chemotaxis protein CheD [Gemmatimonadota bacterium]
MSAGRVVVKVGDLKIAGAGATLVTVGVGSCVAIALYDREARLGGLAHVLLPDPSNGRENAPPGRFASTAVAGLLRLMEEEGARRARMFARLAGGASMFESLLSDGGRTLGMRNVSAARAALERVSVQVTGEDVGGSHGRSIYFHLDDGRLVVSSVLFPDVVL